LSNGIRIANRSLTLYLRRDAYFANKAEEQCAAECAKKFLSDSFSWERDSALIPHLRDLLGLPETNETDVSREIRRALETGELVTKPDPRSSGLNGSRGAEVHPPRSFTVTPSQLFKRVSSVVASAQTYVPRTQPTLSANDYLTMWYARPGDVLPDGRIATALKPSELNDEALDAIRDRLFPTQSVLGDAQPFEYVPGGFGNDTLDLAASTTNPDYAAKMLGYDRVTFRRMIHLMKHQNRLRGNDNVVWHDNGDVYFKDIQIDNMYNY
jgi:hypothetical protein